MRTVFQRLLIVLTLLASLAVSQNSLLGQANDWLQPFPPFRIAGNLYYVGSRGLASYLVTTSEGHILINSNLEESVPMLRASIEKVGFKYNDLKIVLISHAHFDHNAGSALIKKQTGAKYMVMAEDVSTVESGGTTSTTATTRERTIHARRSTGRCATKTR
jgi:metallo-beta-lactamase class B